MIVFPNCKINLGLHITRKRDDGYHDLETVFYPVPVRDVLEIVQAHAVQFSTSGVPVPGENLCQKAYEWLKKDFPQIPPVAMHLHKKIPLGAGLGGGSADGAFTLRLLNEQFRLGLSQDELMAYALQLGSDCPFFIVNKPCLATGRGEWLTPVAVDLSAYSILLVHPGIHVNTGWAFSQIQPVMPLKSLAEIVQEPVPSWRGLLKNDFEEPVCTQYPEMAAIKEKLYQSGAIYASMSGSGSCFYGIFDTLPVIEWPASYTVFAISPTDQCAY